VRSSISTSDQDAGTQKTAPPRSLGRFVLFSTLGVIVALVSLEVLFRILPVSTSSATGYYIDSMILTYPPGQHFTTATGWNLRNSHRHVANNFGFVADHDFERNASAIALIGDSFVEASMLAPEERLASQLETNLEARKVYAMGGPGSSLLDYAERIRFASEKFGIRDFVLMLEHGDIGQALCGSGNVHAACLDRDSLVPRIDKQPPASGLKLLVRDLALPQYLFSQLKLNPVAWVTGLPRTLGIGTKAAGTEQISRDSMNLPPKSTQAVIDEFFRRVQPYPKHRLILILTGTKDDVAADIVRDQLRDAANRNNAMVIEPTPQIDEFAKRSGLSMHVSPADAHLNRIALRIVALDVASQLASRSVLDVTPAKN
jgi:hypothetical protein